MKSSSGSGRAVVFVHYDRDDIVDDYVYHYLSRLRKHCSCLIFVSTAKLHGDDLQKLSKECSEVILRENRGYDFMSYKIGLERFDYSDYEEVVICNDSVYGPIKPLGILFEEMAHRECDFWGITDNRDISYHLQSYFLVFKKDLLRSDAFRKFWSRVEVLDDKNEIIEKYEIGLTGFLQDNGFKSSVYTGFQPTKRQKVNIFLKKFTPGKIVRKMISILAGREKIKRIGKLNATHHFWRELLLSGKMPFIKIELLRDNPMKSDIDDFEQCIHQVSDYDTKLIVNHLARMKASR